jgi:predicted FMN-binding regulatory protein PaiB
MTGKMSDVAHTDIRRSLPSIGGFELEITRVEGESRLGQDEPKKNAMAVCKPLEQSPDDSHR